MFRRNNSEWQFEKITINHNWKNKYNPKRMIRKLIELEEINSISISKKQNLKERLKT